MKGTAVCHFGFGARRRYGPLTNDSLFSVSFSVSVFGVHDIDSCIYPALISSAVGVARLGFLFYVFSAFTDILIYTADALLLVFSWVFSFVHEGRLGSYELYV